MIEQEAVFISALKNAFVPEDERETSFHQIEFGSDKDITKMMLDMFYAVHFMFNNLTGNHMDPIEYIDLILHLLVMEAKGELNREGDESE